MRSDSLTNTLLAVLAVLPITSGHTWVEYVQHISPNGTLLEPEGYDRSHRVRKDFPDDTFLQNKLEGTTLSTEIPMCRPDQTVGSYSADFPRLTASPGDAIAFTYLENGHVTLLANSDKPENRGTVYVYATDRPKNGEKFFDVHEKWTPNGLGGDQRGRLLAMRDFDDGQCYQKNSSPLSKERQAIAPLTNGDGDLKCQTDVTLPEDLPTNGTMTVYWVWIYDGVVDGKTTAYERYTSCLEISMKPKAAGSTKSKAEFVQNPNPALRAVKNQLNDNFKGQWQKMGIKVPSANNGTPQTTPTGTKNPPQPTFTSTRKGHNGIKTVTVTAEPAIQTVFQTITVTAAGNSAQGGAAATDKKVPNVQPFVTTTLEIRARATGQARREAKAGCC